ncbi:AAA family ATPase [Acinetobacter nosocomialis]|uniref:AAA family ATPase n=1 Tax=Acinetobacter nosocomialis TaxID=106654 RepID=UPI001B83047B|nr:AAA family ATPase [Acinetobacter nosocomialis]MBR7716145.1 AAA family ATPase [Acinetobacter nosocomialis]
MKFSVEVKNFGKIKDARINLAPFSVIAGTNSSGKSFLSRALYSFFSTINKDYVTQEAKGTFLSIKTLSHYGFAALREPSIRVIGLYEEFQFHLKNLEESINVELADCTFLEQHTRSILIEDKIIFAEKVIQELQDEVKAKKKYDEFQERLSLCARQLKFLKNNIKEPNEVLSRKLSIEFKNALKENFQVSTLNELKAFNSAGDERISFNFNELGNISIDKENIEFSLNPNSISQFQSLYNIVFVESPIYWKLRKPLLEIKDSKYKYKLWSSTKEESILTGIPKFFYDLMDLLNKNIKIDSDRNQFLEDILIKINQVLSGELDISDNGDIYFRDINASKNINLNVTATGVTNLGIIGLLLKKNVIAKGSFVFIDEPEVNLHPAWQKIMIETLYDLSKNGINIVIATHSIDMIKYIENIMEDLDDINIDNHFAINRLSNDGVSISEGLDPKTSLLKIKDDLGESFYNMVLEQGW